MDRVAVFVDAGYLYAQGSVALFGARRSRSDLTLQPQAAIDALKQAAAGKAPGHGLLRVYWYDGAIGGGRPTADQAALAELDDVKLRLGFVNSSGQQKGVDSLIVTDLIELARLKSISDALLLSGDEDVRVGVQIAQNYGVRVHLLGIRPARGSQSQQLLHEADTTIEWSADEVRDFLSARETDVSHSEAGDDPSVCGAEEQEPATQGSSINSIETVVASYVDGLSDTDVDAIKAYWRTTRGIPSEHDGVVLGRCGNALGKLLDQPEMQRMRAHFRLCVNARQAQ
ncbi:MAG: NYN domain-containing protein [Hyphomicrobiales bacterium]